MVFGTQRRHTIGVLPRGIYKTKKPSRRKTKSRSNKSKKISNIDDSVLQEINSKMLSMIDPQKLNYLYQSNKNFRLLFDKWQGQNI